MTVEKLPPHPDAVFQSGRTSRSSHGQQVGLTLAPITPAARGEFEIPEGVRGALIVQIAPGSAAQEAGLQTGDVILQVTNTTIHSPTQATQAIHRAEARHVAALALRVMRRGQVMFVATPLTGARD